MVIALQHAVNKLNYDFSSGIFCCKDSLYTMIEPDNSPMGEICSQRYCTFEKARVLLTEMESSVLPVLSSVRGTKAGGIMGFLTTVMLPTPSTRLSGQPLKR